MTTKNFTFNSGYLTLALRNSSLLAASAACKILKSPLNIALAIGGIAQLITTVVMIIIVKKFNGLNFLQLNHRIITFNEAHPSFQLVLSIALVVSRFFAFYATIIFGTLLGIYSGLINDIDYFRIQQVNSPVKTNPVMYRL